MIRIKILRDNLGRINTVECAGHSGYAESGKDIVCAAVSAIAQTAYLGLCEVSKKVSHETGEGYFRFICPDPKNETEDIRQQAILTAMCAGLKDVESGYKAYVKMEEQVK